MYSFFFICILIAAEVTNLRPAQIKPLKLFEWKREITHPTLVVELCSVDGCWGRRVSFFKGIVPSRWTMFHCMTLHPCTSQTEFTVSKKTQKKEGYKVGRVQEYRWPQGQLRGMVRGEYNQNTLHAHMKFSRYELRD